jgi:hypothetical protein
MGSWAMIQQPTSPVLSLTGLQMPPGTAWANARLPENDATRQTSKAEKKPVRQLHVLNFIEVLRCIWAKERELAWCGNCYGFC